MELEDWPIRLEFAMSNTCNLMCTHCNGDLSSAIRSRREHRPPVPDLYGEQFFTDIRELLEHVEVTAFLGGEPFLGRHARRIWDHLIDIGREVEVNVTTNGTVWNDQVEHYLRALRMNVAISIDSVHPETFESIRQGARFDEVMAVRDRMFELTRSYGGAFTINHCLLRQNAHELHAMLTDADRRGMRVEVIPVSYPPEQSPLTWDADRRRELVAQLRRIESADGPVTLNADVWHRTLHELESMGDLMEVRVNRPRRIVLPDPDELLAQSIADQTAHGAGRAPLRLELLDGTVHHVEAPEWARPLEPSGWVGLRDEDVLGRLCERFEGEPEWDVRMRWSHVTEVDLTITGPERTVRLRVQLFDWPGSDPPRRVLVIASADLAMQI
jgi:MoaA/NifB/PqqE/SkfB family radical SAM enzyme